MTFDHLLAPGAVVGSNFACTAKFNAAGTRCSMFGAGTILGQTATATMVRGLPAALPEAVDYNAIPPDVVSNRGIPAPPFVGFPLTMLP
ncbi:hypothetical protein ES703_60844 [subsurface metagenome]